MFRWLRKQLDFFGRSGKWPRVRKQHLEKEPACVACGRAKELEVHHIVPYHANPQLELDPDNLITLCADPCHLVHGHLMNFSRSNPDVRTDAEHYRRKMQEFSIEAEVPQQP